jgi:hypothetical protein
VVLGIPNLPTRHAADHGDQPLNLSTSPPR